jgi:pyruvate/2-oxoglutarate dehydrogenase complex dihydrolipoamide dehydrogenase (E3) component
VTHVAVVGAYGSAGSAVASRLAERDVTLTLVDDGDPGGGLCILQGCMPSKEVLSAGAHRFQARHDSRLSGVPTPDPEAIVARKDDHVTEFAAHRRAAVDGLTDREGVRLLREPARFVDDRRLRVGDRTLEPDYVVVATGSTVNVPDLPGLDDVPYHTSADVLNATTFPDSAVVMGFGTVGVELAPYLSEVGGVDVTVIEHDARPLDGADAPFGDALLELYRDAFDVEVLTHASEERVERTADGVRLHLDHERVDHVDAEALCLFTGRRPALDGLGLDETPLDPGPGWVRDTMQARGADRTFVVGDANGRQPVLHVAKEQGFLAAENVLRHRDSRPLEAYESLYHRVTFAGLGVYPFVRVGHSAASARAAGHDPVVVDRAAADDGVFRTKDVPEGRARLVVARDGTVLGYQGLHYHADAMAKTLQVVVEAGTDVASVPARAYHPTTPEILDGLVRAARSELTRD